MNRLHPVDHTDLWRRPEDPDRRPLQRDVLSEADARVLYEACRDGEVLYTGIEGSTVVGLIDAGLLIRVGDDAATLAPRRSVRSPGHRARPHLWLLTRLMAEPLTSSGRTH
ncbi:hypothetical protein [Streptomyces sp. NBC_01233]|uniref:hypothetical protein n=1 Tax=Streptomyces sp. NBC_01233 TaxID=2903787 RepID=UPI002E129AAF|nr:hypothetical protein OG332_23615 [Streptomyces sp. NBC_01233]